MRVFFKVVFYFYLFICLFLAVSAFVAAFSLFSSCRELWGVLSSCGAQPLIVVASLVEETTRLHRL